MSPPCISGPVVHLDLIAFYTFHFDHHVQSRNYNSVLGNYPPQIDQLKIFDIYHRKAAPNNKI